ncbi:MAG: hypothetical protein ACRDN8_25265 [Thermoleophilaceae bacterium]
MRAGTSPRDPPRRTPDATAARAGLAIVLLVGARLRRPDLRPDEAGRPLPLGLAALTGTDVCGAIV